jgi:cytochrome c oxidase subunit I
LAYPGQAYLWWARFCTGCWEAVRWVMDGQGRHHDLPDLYNSFGAMHGTIMVFLAIVPLAVGAFGNYVVPCRSARRTWRFRG